MTYRLAIPPDKVGYAVTDGNAVNETRLDGGASARRLDLLNATSLVNVGWTVDAFEFEYLRAFFNIGTVKGSLPFECDLVIDSSTLTRHTCFFVAGSMKLASHRGGTYVVEAQLEIEPIEYDDPEYEASKLAVFEAFYPGISTGLDLLSLIVNVKWPH